MRKSNLVKILVAILAFSLLLGAIVGITTTAADEGDVYLENANVERNVKYESKTYLLYRVKKSAIKEEDQAALCMQIANADGTTVGMVAPKLDGDYYVFTTQGVPAKEINTKEVVTVMSGSKAISPEITWSVEDYLYARLYSDGYADVTEGGKAAYGVDDGFDFERRQLYYDLLKYGVEAQKLLAPDAEDKIGDSAFVFANDALATYGRFEEPTKITLRYDDSKTPEGKQFAGWQCDMYDAFGDLTETVYAADGSVLTSEGYVKATPVYRGEGYNPTYIDFEGIDALPSNVRVTIPAAKPDSGVISYADGKVSLVKSETGTGTNSYWSVSANTKLEGANCVVFEADFSINITSSLANGSDMAYLALYPNSDGTGEKVYWTIFKHWNGNLYFEYEYTKTSAGGQVANKVEKKTPMKPDGTVYKLRVECFETTWGEDYLFFYVDGTLIHSTCNYYGTKYNDNKEGAAATSVGSLGMNFPEAALGTMTLDNVAMTQCNIAKFSLVGRDDSVIDFDASKSNVTIGNKGENRTYSYGNFDPKTGSAYLLVHKFLSGSGSGMSIDVPITYKETEKEVDYAVLSFDYYMEDTVTRLDNQIYMAHNNYVDKNGVPIFANASTPIMVSLPTAESAVKKYKGEWIHVEVTYEVLETDENDLVKRIKCLGTATNGVSVGVNADSATGVYTFNNKGYFNLFGNPGNLSSGGIDVPAVEDIYAIRISLNNNAYGDVRFDNLSLKLINKADK